MSKSIQKLVHSVFSLAFIVLVIGSYVIVAQTVETGGWKATFNAAKENKIQLSFSRRSEKHGTNNFGQSYDLSELQGLTANQISAPESAVRFSLAREAGTIDCEGKFSNGKGSGTFRFTPNQNFVSAMQSRGYTFTDEKLFAAAALNLTVAFTDDLKSANFGNLTVDDLFKAVIFKITPQFMAEMKATGFPNLDMEDLVKARIFKIDANFVHEVREMGFAKEDLEGLVKFRIFKITPEFIAQVKNEGLANLSVEDMVQLRIFNIDGEFIRTAKAENPNVTVHELVEKRIGVGRRGN